MVAVNDEELLRYSRHILLPQVGIEGQEKVAKSKALVLGLGGLGSPVALYLAAAGLGELVLIDDDQIDESNLQRQVLYSKNSVGENKADEAERKVRELNPAVVTQTILKRLNESELFDALEGCGIAIDCSDNLETRQLINKVCFDKKIPLVFGAAIRFEGQLSVFDFRQEDTPCYQCLYKTLGGVSESCSESGVFSPLVGVVGAMQALEALKLLVGINSGSDLLGKVGIFDAIKSEWKYFNFNKVKDCSVCG